MSDKAPNCTDFPAGLDPAQMIREGFLVAERGSWKELEYLRLRYIYDSRLQYSWNGRRFRAVYLAEPTVFHHPGTTGEGTVCGYVIGFDQRGESGIAAPMEIVAMSAAAFFEAP